MVSTMLATHVPPSLLLCMPALAALASLDEVALGPGGVAVDGVAADGMAADETMIQGFAWKQRRASSLQVNPAHRRQFF